MDLHTPIQDSGRIFKMYKSRLEKLSIFTLNDLLFHIPFRYDDLSIISTIATIQAGEQVTIKGEVVEMKNSYTKSGKKIQKAHIIDGTGELEAIWFNQPYLAKTIQNGAKIALSGKTEKFGYKIVMQSPEYEVITHPEMDLIHTGRLVPVYPETKGVSSKWMRRQIYKLLKEHTQNMLEYIPDSIRENNSLIGLSSAIEHIHFPETLDLSQKARFRLAFDELFLIQLASQKRRAEWNQKLKGHVLDIQKHKSKTDELIKNLPFDLTNAQKKAIAEIFSDLGAEKPMNRLLEGDVGSGKTVVATVAMYVAHLNGFQSVIMAPTEILANQHHKTISDLLEPLGVKVDLVTGSKKLMAKSLSLKEKKPYAIGHKPYAFDILVGTHAVLNTKVAFDHLGLVVIDEQQRFGVEQRAIIREKGTNPHLLTMTATPIPRTVALTLYGDLDLSYLDEMPKNRKKIKTWLVPHEKRDAAYGWIRKQIKETDSQARLQLPSQSDGGQVFIICPFIEESESMQTVKAATKEYERLTKDVFPDLKLAMLHGKMKARDKNAILKDFKDKKYDILVATPVVEVGIDIPNATIMVIEASDRFGLAQLHQLRGRVGRGDKQSYCLLFTESTIPNTLKRLLVMETIHNGAALSEMDLQFRGAGELYGTLQHGKAELKVANFYDFPLIERTRREAERIFKELNKHPLLVEKLASITTKKVSPD